MHPRVLAGTRALAKARRASHLAGSMLRWLLTLFASFAAVQAPAAPASHCAPETATAAVAYDGHHASPARDDAPAPASDERVAPHLCLGCVAGVRQPFAAPPPALIPARHAATVAPALAGRAHHAEPRPPRR